MKPIARTIAERAALLDALAGDSRPSAEQLTELRARHEADVRELERFAQRLGQLRAQNRPH